MKFSLIDFDDNRWEFSVDEIHAVIQDTYTIYIILKKPGAYKTFPATLPNRTALPTIRLGNEIKYGDR